MTFGNLLGGLLVSLSYFLLNGDFDEEENNCQKESSLAAPMALSMDSLPPSLPPSLDQGSGTVNSGPTSAPWKQVGGGSLPMNVSGSVYRGGEVHLVGTRVDRSDFMPTPQAPSRSEHYNPLNPIEV